MVAGSILVVSLWGGDTRIIGAFCPPRSEHHWATLTFPRQLHSQLRSTARSLIPFLLQRPPKDLLDQGNYHPVPSALVALLRRATQEMEES